MGSEGQGMDDDTGARDAMRLESGVFLFFFFVCFLTLLSTLYLQTATTIILAQPLE